VLGYSLAQVPVWRGRAHRAKDHSRQPVKLTVVGVMAEKGVVGNTDYDARLYVPISLAVER
jgi:hypothetical protein